MSKTWPKWWKTCQHGRFVWEWAEQTSIVFVYAPQWLGVGPNGWAWAIMGAIGPVRSQVAQIGPKTGQCDRKWGKLLPPKRATMGRKGESAPIVIHLPLGPDIQSDLGMDYGALRRTTTMSNYPQCPSVPLRSFLPQAPA